MMKKQIILLIPLLYSVLIFAQNSPVVDFTISPDQFCISDFIIPISLDASATTDLDIANGDKLSWSWQSNLSGNFDVQSGTGATDGQTMNTTYETGTYGIHTIILTVTDSDNNTIQYSQEYFMSTLPGPGPFDINENGHCTYNSLTTNNSGIQVSEIQYSTIEPLNSANGFEDNMTYTFDFGDGTIQTFDAATFTSVDHIYTSQVAYNIMLTVTEPDAFAGCQSRTISCVNLPVLLPVKLVEFTGQVVNQKAILKWTTASEINNEKFEIERSFDGLNWLKVGEVAGNGNTQQLLNYTYIDEMPSSISAVQYRLKQIDFDNQFTYSDIISLSNDNLKDNLFFTYVSESTVIANFDLVNANVLKNIKIYDMNGSLVSNLNFDNPMHQGLNTIDISLLKRETGLYFIFSSFEDGKTLNSKLIF